MVHGTLDLCLLVGWGNVTTWRSGEWPENSLANGSKCRERREYRNAIVAYICRSMSHECLVEHAHFSAKKCLCVAAPFHPCLANSKKKTISFQHNCQKHTHRGCLPSPQDTPLAGGAPLPITLSTCHWRGPLGDRKDRHREDGQEVRLHSVTLECRKDIYFPVQESKTERKMRVSFGCGSHDHRAHNLTIEHFSRPARVVYISDLVVQVQCGKEQKGHRFQEQMEKKIFCSEADGWECGSFVLWRKAAIWKAASKR